MMGINNCPFCGGESELVYTPLSWYVRCMLVECEATGPIKVLAEDAVNGWNELAALRQQSAADKARIEALEDGLSDAMMILDTIAADVAVLSLCWRVDLFRRGV